MTALSVPVVALVIMMSTFVGMGYGSLFPENPVLHMPGSSTPVAKASVL
jgi:hypothetical protein